MQGTWNAQKNESTTKTQRHQERSSLCVLVSLWFIILEALNVFENKVRTAGKEILVGVYELLSTCCFVIDHACPIQ